MVCHDVMSFDCLLPVNLLLLKSVLTVHHLLCDLFKQRQSDSGAEHDALSSYHPQTRSWPPQACLPESRASDMHSQYCACAWKPTIGTHEPHRRTKPVRKSLSLPLAAASGQVGRSHTPADSYVVLRCVCVALLCCAGAALHCIIVRVRARAKGPV